MGVKFGINITNSLSLFRCMLKNERTIRRMDDGETDGESDSQTVRQTDRQHQYMASSFAFKIKFKVIIMNDSVVIAITRFAYITVF